MSVSVGRLCQTPRICVRKENAQRSTSNAQRPVKSQRVKGIEPSCAAWEAAVLPLNYTREEIFDFRFSIADCNRNKLRVRIGCLRRMLQRVLSSADLIRDCERVLG